MWKQIKALLIAVVCLGIWTSQAGSQTTGGHGQHADGANSDRPSSCRLPVHPTAEAESRPGGAHYKGLAGRHHNKHGSHSPEMTGAHRLHNPQFGGAFFMAPDKIHHVEAVHREGCGLDIVFYNAFTQPIAADRFRAFITVIPDDPDQPEAMRFLFASNDNTTLYAALGDDVTAPFSVEIYIKFQESDDPELFNVRVPSRAAAEGAANAIDVNIKQRKVVGNNVVRVAQGAVVALRWTTDETVQLHLHGYDIEIMVNPGEPVLTTFKADATGRFPVTAHGFGNHAHQGEKSEASLLYLEVHPD